MTDPVLALFQHAHACDCGHRLVPTCDPAVRLCPDCAGPCPSCGFVHTAELLSLTCNPKSAAITSRDPIAAILLDAEDGPIRDDDVDEVMAVISESLPDPDPRPADEADEPDEGDPTFDAMFGDITFPGG